VVVGFENFFTVLLGCLLFIIAFGVGLLLGDPLFDPSFSLKRKCLACGVIFIGKKRFEMNLSECAKCGYNLTGNTSGKCPECGWKLPDEYVEHIRGEESRG